MTKTTTTTTQTEEQRLSVGEADAALVNTVMKEGSQEAYFSAMEKVNAELEKQGIEPMDISGTIGAPIYQGWVASDEANPSLTGAAKYVTYQNILINTSIVGAGVRYFLNMLSNAKWQVTPANDSEEAKKYADLAVSIMGDMKRTWANAVRKGAMYRFHGFSLQQWIPKIREDGAIGLFDLAPRPQSTIERWHQDKDGYIDAITQRDPITSEEYKIPIWKLVYLLDDTLTDSPEGLGIFRHLVKPAETLARYLELEGFGFETDLRGIPVGRAPLSVLDDMQKRKIISPEQKDQILSPLKNFITNHIRNPKLGMVMDSAIYTDKSSAVTPSQAQQWDLNLLTAQSSSQGEIANAIDRMTHDLARGIGVQQLLLGSGKVGTQALSKDNSKNFLLIVSSSLKEQAAGYDRQLWKPVWDMNGVPEALRPKVWPEEIQLSEVETITKALNDLAKSGAVLHPNDPAINELRQLLGISPQEKWDIEEYLKITGKSTELPGGEKTTPSQVSGKTESEKD